MDNPRRPPDFSRRDRRSRLRSRHGAPAHGSWPRQASFLRRPASRAPSSRASSARASSYRAALAVAAAVGAIMAAGTAVPGAPLRGADAGRAGASEVSLEAPVTPFAAARLFDRPDAPWAAGHRGIDLFVAEGTRITSPGAGVVSFAGNVVDRGVVTVDHGGGHLSSVEPVVATVAVGDRVDAGDTLGVVSGEAGHCAPLTCLHWGVRFHGAYVNPLDVLAGYGRIVLLP